MKRRRSIKRRNPLTRAEQIAIARQMGRVTRIAIGKGSAHPQTPFLMGMRAGLSSALRLGTGREMRLPLRRNKRRNPLSRKVAASLARAIRRAATIARSEWHTDPLSGAYWRGRAEGIGDVALDLTKGTTQAQMHRIVSRSFGRFRPVKTRMGPPAATALSGPRWSITRRYPNRTHRRRSRA